MMKKFCAAVCAAAMLLTGAALAETDVRVTALKGPTAMGMVELMNEAESGAVNGNAYDFTIAAAVDEVSPKLVKGETDIAAAYDAGVTAVFPINPAPTTLSEALAHARTHLAFTAENVLRFARCLEENR